MQVKFHIRYLKIALKSIFLFFKIIIGGIIIYLFLVILGTIIPSGQYQPSKDGEISIYLTTNGIHSDLVLPIRQSNKDWLKHLSPDFQKYQAYRYVALGWGDYDFYLQSKKGTDIWDIINTLFIPSKGILHLQFYRNELIENEQVIGLKISQKQYINLCQYIENQLITNKYQQLSFIENGYGSDDYFFAAKGTYHLFNTCNNWTNGGLKVMNIRTGLWTPFAQCIWFWL
jgi:uncharacterized protein (TIGR02117 family)